MNIVQELFEQRDKKFASVTMEIFEHIHNSLVCITDFLNDNDPVFAAADVTWEDANLANDQVTIIGMIDFNENTTVTIDGEEIEITADNKEYFQRVIHLSLPFGLVIEGDYNTITQFLTEMKQHEEALLEEAINLESITPAVNTAQSFDLSKLTQSQRNSLILFEKGKH